MSSRVTERRFVLGCIAVGVIAIVVAAVLAPANNGNDPEPTTTNTGAPGAKAAYLLLERLGYQVSRWEKPLTDLDQVDAAHTTLVLATPSRKALARDRDGLANFLHRGGRVVATGASGADLLPQQSTKESSGDPCETKPEGVTQLAQAGSLTLKGSKYWKDDIPIVDVSQRCPDGGAVVVSYPVGPGRVIWWNDVAPLTNRGLHQDANLQLLLASVGDARQHILFDEYLHQDHDVLWRSAGGTPLTALELQVLLVFALLIFSFSRRNGPILPLVTSSRTSPLEFAHSMGNLYHRAGAGEAATGEARQRFFGVLERQCGLSRETLQGPAAGIAAALQERFGYHDPALVDLLIHTGQDDRISPGVALRQVQQLHRCTENLQRSIRAVSGHLDSVRGNSPGA